MTREEKRAYNRAYLEKNRAAILERRRQYYRENKDKFAKWQKASDARHRAKRTATNRLEIQELV